MIEQLLRKFPPFKGKQRIARLLLLSKIRRGTPVQTLGKYGCRYKLPNIQENIGFEILINGIYEEETIAFICSTMKNSGVFLDIGANIGAISIPVKMLRPDIDIVCIEASPWIFNYLESNVEINELNNIQLLNKAISDASEQQVDFFSPTDKFGKGSMAPIFTSNSVKVSTITLDDVMYSYNEKTIDFIKVDVEGFEALAFKGGVKLLGGANAPDILFEHVDWAENLAGELPGSAQLILLGYGYTLYLFEYGKIGAMIKKPLAKGGHMIFATKRALNKIEGA